MIVDWGFDIAELVAMVQAQLHIPAFTKGKKQLSPVEVEDTRKIANVRIYVKGLLGVSIRSTKYCKVHFQMILYAKE